jgi:hypothetical protein
MGKEKKIFGTELPSPDLIALMLIVSMIESCYCYFTRMRADGAC